MTRLIDRLTLALLLLSIACSSSGGGQPGSTTPRISVTTEPAGQNCAAGGQKLELGLDTNANGVLDPSEVQSTSYVCNGSSGQVGLAALVNVSDLAPGATCAAGGKQIETGLDSNGNGVLDSTEVTDTQTLCNGEAASPLVFRTTAVSPGQEGCANGGHKLEIGYDTGAGDHAGNGGLDDDEVIGSLTRVVCNGADTTPGVNSLIATRPTSYTDCFYGGIWLDSGLDNGDSGGIANDGLLQSGEVDHSTPLCRASFPQPLALDIEPGPSPSLPGKVTSLNGLFIFDSKTAEHGRELYRSDGTPEGTVLLKALNPNGDGFYQTVDPVVFKNELYFSGNDGVSGWELWKTDGTTDGTVRVKDIDPGDGNSSYPSAFVEFDGALYFRAAINGEGKLHRTDGSLAGTVTIDAGSLLSLTPRGAVNGRLIVSAYDNGTLGLYGYDVQTGFTLLVTLTDPLYRATVGSYYYFLSDEGGGNLFLWRTDGTAQGTLQLKKGNGPQYASRLTEFNGQIYFAARYDNTQTGLELWKTDGTVAGTSLVVDINPGKPHSQPGWLTVFKGKLFFAATTVDNGRELWSSDGTEAGTKLFADLISGPDDSNPGGLFIFNGALFFLADSRSGRHLWVTDGTAYGTRLAIQTDPSGSFLYENSEFSIVGDRVLFTATSAATGWEWFSFGIN